MNPKIAPLRELYELNTRLFVNCLQGIDDGTARQRLNGTTNNVAFIVAHLVDARFYLSKILGLELENPLEASLGDVNSVDEAHEFPNLDALRGMWSELADVLDERLREITGDELSADAPSDFPVADNSILGGVAFLVQHESYHIGQLAFLRKCLDFGPMSYEVAS